MKYPKLLLALPLFLAAGVFAHAQETSTRSVTQSAHYEIIAEPGAEGNLAALSNELELRYEVFNDLFRFAQAPALLKARVFVDEAAYDAYVGARLGGTRPGAVYLHYNQAERRELVVLRGSAEEASMTAHQAFVQFFRGAIPNPPTWMREGFAIYFNSVQYDPVNGELRYEENLAWLETVKKLETGTLTPEEILRADTVSENASAASAVTANRFSRDFQICSWAFVSFLLNSGTHFRTLTESFMLLSPDSSAAENSAAVLDRFSLWVDMDTLGQDFLAYLDSRRTFAELMETGRSAYAAKDAMTAEMAFLAALDQRPDNYAPYYYLGLIYYEEKLYDMAEEHYRLSLEYGADEALVSYAIGLNAVSAGRAADARAWLEKAAALDPDRYREKTGELLPRLE